MRDALWGALTGAALVLAAPPWNASGLAWVAFWPLLHALPDRSLGTRVLSGSVAGVVWSVGTVGPWLFPATRAHLATTAASAAALTFVAAWLWGGVYLALLAAIHPRLPRPLWLSMPAAWIIGEAARTHLLGGAPWSLLGHSQHDVLLVRQLAELGGVTAVSFVVCMPSAALASPPRDRRAGLVAAAIALAATLAFGASRVGGVAAPGIPRQIRIASGENAAPDAVARYAGAGGAGHADLTVWPEGATPGYLQEEAGTRATIETAAREHGWLLTGARRYEGSGDARRYFNSAVLFDPTGRVVAHADKRHLVPLAERNVLGWQVVPRPFTSGDGDPVPLAAGSLQIGALVCWDVLFPELSRALVGAGANVLANLSSDRSLDRAVPQLVAAARFRAVETRRWLVRASGAGRSLAIDPLGRVVATDAVAIGGPTELPLTLYVRLGEVVPWLAALLLAALVIREHRERRDAPTHERRAGVPPI